MFCTTPCNGNSYGPNCSLTCGKCLRVKAKIKVRDVFNSNHNNGDACNRETGACLYGCQPGYTGINCESPCEPGWFGLNCSQRCPQCPEGRSCTCDPVTGQCTGMSCKAPQVSGELPIITGLTIHSVHYFSLLVSFLPYSHSFCLCQRLLCPSRICCYQGVCFSFSCRLPC